ncbi:pentapeptide repeat-containing protein [Escherichia coli]|uniref:pentapeptide repeat-containing protein n=1 Tax=Escherichia coli TaxID=562 RepID=UPI002A4EE4BB|nr:pentapeptide repeat-containing protein [Escherichia coli]MDC9144427.1 pentapeptide repeat-containing protein [Escherichia coli]
MDIIEKRITKRHLSESELSGVNYYNCIFERIQLDNFNFRDCEFEKCRFVNCSIKNLKLNFLNLLTVNSKIVYYKE